MICIHRLRPRSKREIVLIGSQDKKGRLCTPSGVNQKTRCGGQRKMSSICEVSRDVSSRKKYGENIRGISTWVILVFFYPGHNQYYQPFFPGCNRYEKRNRLLLITISQTQDQPWRARDNGGSSSVYGYHSFLTYVSTDTRTVMRAGNMSPASVVFTSTLIIGGI